jgi:hypothetical protein
MQLRFFTLGVSSESSTQKKCEYIPAERNPITGRSAHPDGFGTLSSTFKIATAAPTIKSNMHTKNQREVDREFAKAHVGFEQF